MENKKGCVCVCVHVCHEPKYKGELSKRTMPVSIIHSWCLLSK